jgi:arylsulfatase A-like enzyme
MTMGPARPADGEEAAPEPALTVAGAARLQLTPVRPPAGAPNVVVIVLDDTGFAQLGCFGSDIATPHMDRLARGGLRYNRFHVTALCSPTRAAFMTGRNHHAVGMGFLADIPLAYPGYTTRLPKSAAPLPRLLRDAGYSTMAVGKWHLTPRFERSAAGPFGQWPLGLGFERYYGFLQGDTNHWAPNLVQDNHYVDPPAGPQDGYHLSEDLASTAVRFLLDQQHAAPGKPFFLYFALGATHAPHHVAPEWVEPYRGQFDEGWDAWREQTFTRQLAAGVVPDGTVLTRRPEWVAGWAEVDAAGRRMHARQQEVYAGFLAHADAQIGRLITFLEHSGQLDNTLILLFSDNGASAEGGAVGSFNEHRFSAGLRESVAGNLAHYDDWGGPGAYNHYSWAWAWAGNTPFRLWKRYTWLGGTRTPLIVHWPRQIAGAGAVRSAFVHVTDLFATVLEAAGIDVPGEVDGVAQQPVDGASIRPTFADAAAAGPRDTQYFEMLGSRSIVHGRWKATTDHISSGVVDEEELAVGSRRFEDDRWALFDLDRDFSEGTDVAAAHPGVVADLERRWLAEAERNHVLPIDDSLVNRLGAIIGPAWPAGADRTFRPGGGPVSDEALPALFGGFRLSADVVAAPDPAGVLFALGDWNGGFALYLTGGRLAFTYSRAGDLLEVTADRPLRPGPQTLGVTCSLEPGTGGTLRLWCGDVTVGVLDFAGSLPFALQHGGAGLRLGYDSGLPVSPRYTVPAPWNGQLASVRVQTPGPSLPSPAEEISGALHAD